MIGNPFVGAGRIAWMEFWSHLKSPRLLVLVVLLALLVFGVSYGMSQPSPVGGFSSPIFVVHPAIRNESGVDHYLVIGWVADARGVPTSGASVDVYYRDYLNYSGSPNGTWVTTLQTNSTGFVLYDAGTMRPQNSSYAMTSGVYGFATASFDLPMTNATLTVGGIMSGSYSSPSGSASYFSFHVMTMDGYPATAADILLDGNVTGHPDGNGFYSGSLPEGNHMVTISYKGYQESYPVYGMVAGGPAYENGADMVLMALVGTFMPLVLPIMAIAISFDAIARERAQGSLELLLARRVRREGILAGKFLGAFASISLPVVGVLLAGVAAVTAISGRAPTTTFALAAFGGSLFLIAVYVLLMLLFSTLAKSVGTAVVFGVVTWLFFNVLFSFLTMFLLFSTGGGYFSSGFYSTLLTLYLFDPNTLYQLILGASLPGTGGGFSVGIVPTGYVSLAAIALAVVLWIAIPLVLTLFVFRKRAES